jgi:hypothetical protein
MKIDCKSLIAKKISFMRQSIIQVILFAILGCICVSEHHDIHHKNI